MQLHAEDGEYCSFLWDNRQQKADPGLHRKTVQLDGRKSTFLDFQNIERKIIFRFKFFVYLIIYLKFLIYFIFTIES